MLEAGFTEIAQWLLTPILWLLAAALVYALWMTGAVLVEAWQRRSALFRSLPDAPDLALDEIELIALRQLEPLRLLSRVTPMLGLIATMIPLGPALHGVASGNGSAALVVFSDAFAGVVLALTAAAIGLVLYSLRRRWLLGELLAIRKRREGAA